MDVNKYSVLAFIKGKHDDVVKTLDLPFNCHRCKCCRLVNALAAN